MTCGRMWHSKFLIVKIMLFCFSGLKIENLWYFSLPVKDTTSIAKTQITLDAYFMLYFV